MTKTTQEQSPELKQLLAQTDRKPKFREDLAEYADNYIANKDIHGNPIAPDSITKDRKDRQDKLKALYDKVDGEKKSVGEKISEDKRKIIDAIDNERTPDQETLNRYAQAIETLLGDFCPNPFQKEYYIIPNILNALLPSHHDAEQDWDDLLGDGSEHSGDGDDNEIGIEDDLLSNASTKNRTPGDGVRHELGEDEDRELDEDENDEDEDEDDEDEYDKLNRLERENENNKARIEELRAQLLILQGTLAGKNPDGGVRKKIKDLIDSGGFKVDSFIRDFFPLKEDFIVNGKVDTDELVDEIIRVRAIYLQDFPEISIEDCKNYQLLIEKLQDPWEDNEIVNKLLEALEQVKAWESALNDNIDKCRRELEGVIAKHKLEKKSTLEILNKKISKEKDAKKTIDLYFQRIEYLEALIALLYAKNALGKEEGDIYKYIVELTHARQDVVNLCQSLVISVDQQKSADELVRLKLDIRDKDDELAGLKATIKHQARMITSELEFHQGHLNKIKAEVVRLIEENGIQTLTEDQKKNTLHLRNCIVTFSKSSAAGTDDEKLEYYQSRIELLEALIRLDDAGNALEQETISSKNLQKDLDLLQKARKDLIEFCEEKIGELKEKSAEGEESKSKIKKLEKLLQDVRFRLSDANGKLKASNKKLKEAEDEKAKLIDANFERLNRNRLITNLEESFDSFVAKEQQNRVDVIWQEITALDASGRNGLGVIAYERAGDLARKLGFADFNAATQGIGARSVDEQIEFLQAVFVHEALTAKTASRQNMLWATNQIISALQQKINNSTKPEEKLQLEQQLKKYQTQRAQLNQPELNGQIMLAVAGELSDYLEEKVEEMESPDSEEDPAIIKFFKESKTFLADKYHGLQAQLEPESSKIANSTKRDFHFQALSFVLALKKKYGGEQGNIEFHQQQYHQNSQLVFEEGLEDDDTFKKLTETAQGNLIGQLNQILRSFPLQEIPQNAGYGNILATFQLINGRDLTEKALGELVEAYQFLIEFEARTILVLEKQKTEANPDPKSPDNIKLSTLKTNLERHKKEFDLALETYVGVLVANNNYDFNHSAQTAEDNLQNELPGFVTAKLRPEAHFNAARNENRSLPERLRAISSCINYFEAELEVVRVGGKVEWQNQNGTITERTAEDLIKQIDEAKKYRDQLNQQIEASKPQAQSVPTAIATAVAAGADKTKPNEDLPIKSAAQLRRDNLEAYDIGQYNSMLAKMLQLGSKNDRRAFDPVITAVKAVRMVNGKDLENFVQYQMAYYDPDVKAIVDVVVPQKRVESFMARTQKEIDGKVDDKLEEAHDYAISELKRLAQEIKTQTENPNIGADHNSVSNVTIPAAIPENFDHHSIGSGALIQTTRSNTADFKKDFTTQTTVKFAAIDSEDLSQYSKVHYIDLTFGGKPIQNNVIYGQSIPFAYKLETKIAQFDGEENGFEFKAGDPLVRVVRVALQDGGKGSKIKTGSVIPLTDYYGNLLEGIDVSGVYDQLRNPDQTIVVQSQHFDVDKNLYPHPQRVEFKGLSKVRDLSSVATKALPRIIGVNKSVAKTKFKVGAVVGKLRISNVKSDSEMEKVIADLLPGLRAKIGQRDQGILKKSRPKLEIDISNCDITNLDFLQKFAGFDIALVGCKNCHQLTAIEGLAAVKTTVKKVVIKDCGQVKIEGLAKLRERGDRNHGNIKIDLDKVNLAKAKETNAKNTRGVKQFYPSTMLFLHSAEVKSKGKPNKVLKSIYRKIFDIPQAIIPKNVEAMKQAAAIEPGFKIKQPLNDGDLLAVHQQAIKSGNSIAKYGKQSSGNPLDAVLNLRLQNLGAMTYKNFQSKLDDIEKQLIKWPMADEGKRRNALSVVRDLKQNTQKQDWDQGQGTSGKILNRKLLIDKFKEEFCEALGEELEQVEFIKISPVSTISHYNQQFFNLGKYPSKLVCDFSSAPDITDIPAISRTDPDFKRAITGINLEGCKNVNITSIKAFLGQAQNVTYINLTGTNIGYEQAQELHDMLSGPGRHKTVEIIGQNGKVVDKEPSPNVRPNGIATSLAPTVLQKLAA